MSDMIAYMRPNPFRVLAGLICFAALLSTSAASALAGVVVHDMVVVKGEKVMLSAETRGKIFTKGGELVEFFVDGKTIGRTLSGGDGIAFLQFVPARTGLYEIKVKSGSDEADGYLLSLKRGTSIVFVDVEGTLAQGLFSTKPRQGSQKAVKEINDRLPIVFLQTSFIGLRAVKKWLKENGFVHAPLLGWRQGEIFDGVAEDGFTIKAVVGGPKVIESARGHKGLSLSFEQADDAEEVASWEEVSKKLK